ncbi:RluA family pseudouridine synthase [Flammeovirga yaeyamensis]|uniref:Pseudouridine synthase n=1 Tax=Flammeovirga yaeyamensis TaxID=367791 RepID=A0AAX1NC48_9BACT|nr:RluA family pseudouridine synthase [Flammeovirga yaeyamensis]MBB3697829.1 23S rRNA pseudouridine1911/1915/1917 synthase [Flammeovirga yaeyamensis]NMF35815.1 RluA family pseudouridine synthase [Flammeovirga yaeyamensis]QWG03233.1 RluA family pseudouridine synthase [Flammeovirga yaeyamensis]
MIEESKKIRRDDEDDDSYFRPEDFNLTEEDLKSVQEFDELKIEVDPKQQPLRIDRFLVDRIPNLSRNRIQSGLKEGHFLVNGLPVKPNYKVTPGDVVMVFMPKPRSTELEPQDIPLDIVYEDNDLLIVNKKPGMVVHPGFNNTSGTLVNALVYHFKGLPTSFNGEDKPGLVHRIDKDTSGLLVIAKNENALTHLSKQFYDHTIERTYQALVWGTFSDQGEEGTLTTMIGRSESDRRMYTVIPDESTRGKKAITHYKQLKDLRYVSLVECKLETGRTHQIRVHMKHLGHPLFSDQMYGGDKILKGERTGKYKTFVDNNFKICPRQALHAKSLGFVHPTTNEWMQFDSEIPQDMQKLIKRWEDYLKYS